MEISCAKFITWYAFASVSKCTLEGDVIFLISIDSRLGSALEVLVPKAFGDDSDASVDDVKKEQAHS